MKPSFFIYPTLLATLFFFLPLTGQARLFRDV